MDTSPYASHTTIQYWKGLAKHANGGKISTMVLKWQAMKGQLIFSCTHWALSGPVIIQENQIGL